MGDLPLRTPNDRCLGGPLPRQQANHTHPHPLPINLCSIPDAGNREHQALIRLSTGYSWVRGRLDTRYSPVRRSPSLVASNQHAAPRLACVKPVASVHPEPGSNSTLYNFYLHDYKAMPRNTYYPLRTTVRKSLLSKHLTYKKIWRQFIYPSDINATRFLYYFSRICLCKSIKELFLMCFRKRCSLKAGAKLRTFLIPTKYFEEKIVFILHFIFLFDINQHCFSLHIII